MGCSARVLQAIRLDAGKAVGTDATTVILAIRRVLPFSCAITAAKCGEVNGSTASPDGQEVAASSTLAPGTWPHVTRAGAHEV
jgi:hypothetical protein